MLTAKVVRFNIRYDAFFRQPVFSLPSTASQVLDPLYAEFSRHFGVGLKDLKVASGEETTDFAIKLSLFKGLGGIELNIDRFGAFFDELVSPNDFSVAEECLRRTEAVLATAVNQEFRETHVNFAGWLSCDGGRASAEEFLRDHAPTNVPIPTGFANCDQVEFKINATLRSLSELWAVTIQIEPSLRPETDLFLMVDGIYASGSTYSSLESRHQHLASLAKAFLGQANLDVALQGS